MSIDVTTDAAGAAAGSADVGARRSLLGNRVVVTLLGVAGVAIALGVMELVVRVGIISESDMPPVSKIVPRFVDLLGEGGFWTDMRHTLLQALEGLAIGAVIAVPLGAAIGSIELVWRGLRPTIEFLRPVPAVALIPLVTLVWGPTGKSVVVLCAFVSLWPLLIQAIYGVREVDEVARDAARAYGLGRARRAVRVVFPSALPFLMTGMRLASSASLIIAITVELIAGSPGLGQRINLAESGGDNEQLYALILAAGILGLVVNVVLARLERRFLRWSPAFRST